MKRNESGLYGVVEGEIFITDEESGEKMIFVLDKENEVVIRSLLENDIKSVAKIVKGSSSEKRNYMRSLWDFIPQKGSENYAFVVEIDLDNNTAFAIINNQMTDKVSIAEDAFEESESIGFICESENVAAAYAKKHHIPYWIR